MQDDVLEGCVLVKGKEVGLMDCVNGVIDGDSGLDPVLKGLQCRV